jgi:hypothetical protein
MSEVTRADIAAVLDGLVITYAGQDHVLSATPSQPAALAVWQAWPDWQSAAWLSACAIERTWLVYVILPAADPVSWTEGTDAILTPVRNALIQLGQVQRAEPIALVAAEQSLTMPAVSFTLLT